MKKMLLSFLTLIALAAPGAFAQSKLALQPNDTIHSVLAQQVGKPIELRMKSSTRRCRGVSPDASGGPSGSSRTVASAVLRGVLVPLLVRLLVRVLVR